MVSIYKLLITSILYNYFHPKYFYFAYKISNLRYRFKEQNYEIPD